MRLLAAVHRLRDHLNMQVRRFRTEDLSGERAVLDGAEARHALLVLRLKVGDPVRLFDGRGNECEGLIESTQSGILTVRLHNRLHVTESPSRPGLRLAVATPKGPRADWLVEKCGELGVATLQPLICRRSEVHPQAGKLERWRRLCGQAARQSGQATVMAIHEPLTLTEFLSQTPAGTSLWAGDPAPDAKSWASVIPTPLKSPAESTVWLMIGPEGGWTDEERAAILAGGGQPVRLASTVLRIETAAVAAAAVWAAAQLTPVE